MKTALGAYTPNVPWAEIDCSNIVDMDGAGTSAATPQIAAAAALWLAEHWDVVKNYSQPWMRIEAVRFALFSAGVKSTAKMGAGETFEKIGQGVIRADAALSVMPPAENQLRKTCRRPSIRGPGWTCSSAAASVWRHAGPRRHQRRRMLALELTQMAQRVDVGRRGDRRSGRRPRQDLGRRAQPLPGGRARRRQSVEAAAGLSRRRCWRRPGAAVPAARPTEAAGADQAQAAPAAAAQTPAAHLCARSVGRQAPRFGIRPSGDAVRSLGRPAGDGRAAAAAARSANISKSSTSIRRRTASTIRSTSTTRSCLPRTVCRRRKAIRSFTSRWSMPSP